MGIFGNSKLKLFAGEDKVKKAYLGTEKIYSVYDTVTYYVDRSVSYQEEVASGADCLNPTTFTPIKDGWTFVGWRENATASSEVLSSKVMGDEPITLYAVFSREDITLTYYNDTSEAATITGKRYYNYGNIKNPKFTLSQASKSGWTARGWAASPAIKNEGLSYEEYNAMDADGQKAYYESFANVADFFAWYNYAKAVHHLLNPYNEVNGDDVTYSKINNTEFAIDAILYGMYKQSITLTYDGDGADSGSVVSQTKTRYYTSPDDYKNPTFTLAENGFVKDGYEFTGWDIGAAGANVTLEANTTAYAQWSSEEYVVTYYVDNGKYYTEDVKQGNSIIHPTTFEVTKDGWTLVGWRKDTTASGDILLNEVMGDEPVTLYAVFKQDVTLTYYDNSTTPSITSGTRYYNFGNIANPTFTIPQASKSGWTARGWSTGTAANASVAYNSISDTAFGSNTTLYGLYQQTIYLYYDGNGASSGTVSTQSGTRYYNSSGDTKDATFKLASNGFSRSDYTFAGWNLGNVGDTIILSGTTTAYAQWKHEHTEACYHHHTDSCYAEDNFAECGNCGRTEGDWAIGEECTCGGTFDEAFHRYLICNIQEGAKICGHD